MAFNIETFKSKIEKSGVLQTNKYDVSITLPKLAPKQFGTYNIVSTNGTTTGGTTDELMYRCINASLPGLTMRTNDINRFGIGITEKMPYSANYTDISLTFLMDRSSSIYDFWYAWFNYIFGVTGQESNKNIFGTVNNTNDRSFYTAEYKDNYAADIKITVYDTTGKPSMVATLFKAYPISINDIALNWSDNNNLIKLTTTITFREWALGDGSNQIVTLK